LGPFSLLLRAQGIKFHLGQANQALYDLSPVPHLSRESMIPQVPLSQLSPFHSCCTCCCYLYLCAI
jgi:hypothetical protein